MTLEEKNYRGEPIVEVPGWGKDWKSYAIWLADRIGGGAPAGWPQEVKDTWGVWRIVREAHDNASAMFEISGASGSLKEPITEVMLALGAACNAAAARHQSALRRHGIQEKTG
jgi:hypothetical protein